MSLSGLTQKSNLDQVAHLGGGGGVEGDLGSCGIRTWALQVKSLRYSLRPLSHAFFICFYILQFNISYYLNCLALK
jgi:hypothetical protein